MTVASVPLAPAFTASFHTPAASKRRGGDFTVETDALTAGKVAFVNMEYQDTFGQLDRLKIVYDDPFHALCDHPLIREGLNGTQVWFSFGYSNSMTPTRRMQLTRVAQTYPASGRVQTELYFFTKGLVMGLVRRMTEYSFSNGKPMLASNVAEAVARLNGLDFNSDTIVPVRAVGNAARFGWKQTGETDIEFLRKIARGCRAADGRQGRYAVFIRNAVLHFRPLNIDEEEVQSFTYRGTDTPLRVFTPILPSDFLLGVGYDVGVAGIDPNSGGTVSKHSRPSEDPQNPISGLKTVLPDSSMARDSTIAPQFPLLGRLQIGSTDMLNSIQQLLNATQKRIQDTENSMRQQQKTQAEINVATTSDRLLLAQQLSLVRCLEDKSRAVGDCISKPPSTDVTGQWNADDTARWGVGLAMTASAQFWGVPYIHSGMSIVFDGVSQRFGGKWWVTKATHRINRQEGFETQLELQKVQLAVGDVGATGTPSERRDAMVRTVTVVDAATLTTKVEPISVVPTHQTVPTNRHLSPRRKP